MTNSAAAERPVLPDEQRQELNDLKLTWDRFYDISCDGALWRAVPKGTQDIIEADSRDRLARLISLDAPGRCSPRGHFIETASGPPFWVEHRDRGERATRSC
jgi:hypothetical protein